MIEIIAVLTIMWGVALLLLVRQMQRVQKKDPTRFEIERIAGRSVKGWWFNADNTED